VGILFFRSVAEATERKAPHGGANVFSSLTGLDNLLYLSYGTGDAYGAPTIRTKGSESFLDS